MIKFISIVFAALLFLQMSVFADATLSKDNTVTDRKSDWYFKSYIDVPVTLFLIQYKDSPDIEYDENYTQNIGGAIGYKGFSISYDFSYESTYDPKIYGKTNSFEIVPAYFERKFGMELFYQDLKGFYLADPEKFSYNKGDPQTIRKDIHFRNLTYNMFYCFSDNFSLKAVFDQTEQQAEWDWSFFLMGTLNYTKISANQSLVPPSVEYGLYSDYQGAEYYSIGVLPGIGVTVPFWNFFITGVIFAGPGFLYNVPDNDIDKGHSNFPIIIYQYMLCAGYNSETFFLGSSVILHSVENLETKETFLMQLVETDIKLYAGIHF